MGKRINVILMFVLSTLALTRSEAADEASGLTSGPSCPADFKDGEPIYDHNDRLSAEDAFNRYQTGLREFRGGKPVSATFKRLSEKKIDGCMDGIRQDILAMDKEMSTFIKSTNVKSAKKARARLEEIRKVNSESPLIKNFWYGEDQREAQKPRTKPTASGGN